MAISITAPILSMALAFGVSTTDEVKYTDNYDDVLNDGVFSVIPTKQQEIVWGNNVNKLHRLTSEDKYMVEAFKEWEVVSIDFASDEDRGVFVNGEGLKRDFTQNDKQNDDSCLEDIDCPITAYDCDCNYDECVDVDGNIVDMNKSQYDSDGNGVKLRQNPRLNNDKKNDNYKSYNNSEFNDLETYRYRDGITEKADRVMNKTNRNNASLKGVNANELEKHKAKYKFNNNTEDTLRRSNRLKGFDNEHLVIFPVGKSTPTKIEFNNLGKYIPLKNISEAVIIGWASPDGKKPDMQEELAYKRMIKVKEELERNNINVSLQLNKVCSAKVERWKCWKAEIYYKLRSK